MKPDDIASHLESVRRRFAELEARLADPAVYSNQAECKRVSRERQRLGSLIGDFDAWDKALKQLSESKELLQTESDAELKELAESEIQALGETAAKLEGAVRVALAPPDPNDSRDTIVEIRPAAGGEEASLFAAEVFRLYQKYAELRSWKYELLDLSDSDLGGIKEAVFSLSGDDVFSRMKFESGVHRVQRVPATEAQGRIHTSTITVSVLPEAEDVDEVQIRSEDLRIDTYRSSGAGGQYVNRTDSAVRITHLPSGLVVASQQERSQIRNREVALRILKARLFEMKQRAEAEKQAASKRSQVGTGDRSERIRTYNFPQNRVTDHRYGVSVHDLPRLMEGELDSLLNQILDIEGQRRIDSLLGLTPQG
jgi:peptide chain release factor 1